jgi:predicted phosphodiesterase
MRYGIFSDIHSNQEAFSAVIDAYRKESIDLYICVGDVVGYGANPNECVAMVKALGAVTVAGNHDWACVGKTSVEYFNPFAQQAVAWTKKTLEPGSHSFLESLPLVYKNSDLTVVHGTLPSPQDFNYMTNEAAASDSFNLQETPVCFVGHSHIAGLFREDADQRIIYAEDDLGRIVLKEGLNYIVNVGSVGQPRDFDWHAAYAIYDTQKKVIQIKRSDYDVQSARKKIIDYNLPKYLGDRLLVGR